MVIFAAVCFTSLLAWPAINHLAITLFKWLVAIGLAIFFILQWLKLKLWSFEFWVDEAGQASCDQLDAPCQIKLLWISPLILVFQLRDLKRKRLVLVWRDMLDDTSYRHLCRLLLRYG
ncbi:hypothetical protein L1D21_03060 [Shewanella sp. Isolate11]|nr:protein YgfX [Shewanella sp. Isolate11]MCG9695937.1 hypothetical protein [Shewanella sp. Isolate11]